MHFRSSSRVRDVAMALAVAPLLVAVLSCAGAPSLSRHVGACAEAFDGCHDRCDRLVDSRDCQLLCDFEGRQCNARQGQSQFAFSKDTPRLGDDTAVVVDLFERKVVHSKTVDVQLKGDVTWVAGAHELAPGGGISLRYRLPDERMAELVLLHAPMGRGACLVTITVGEKTLVGRYQPPRTKTGAIKPERFDLTQLLPDPPEDPEAPIVLEVFIFNNNVAGSVERYRLGSVQLFYRALE